MTENALADPLNVLLVGCGNIGYALLKGCLAPTDGTRMHVVEPDETLRARAEAAGASASAVSELPEGFTPDVIILAVKPFLVAELLPQYSALAAAGTMILSVAAGITLSGMQAAVGTPAAIIRCMPNTPASIGAGAMVCCGNAQVSQRQTAIAEKLLSPCGKVYFIDDESQMDAVTAVSGSGPAYLFHFIECLADAGVKAGLDKELAGELALQTIYGASLLATRSEDPASVLREKVTSPNGTTAAALAVLMGPDGIAPHLTEAVAAAKARSIELSGT
ncbi:pyrroline-5-carboxylate reductase [Rhizobium sp. ACO-34A]|nr:pyrroline-5-carboxylate reductase [Rhizobium sp. ACO-34A]ATN35981.1 pyrroline-5-carboxylate reductase [Rhizobium sp. ACO-34A]